MWELIVVPIARSVMGWFENVVEDCEISTFEWCLLGATLLRMGIVGFGIFIGTDMTAMSSAVGALVLDMLTSKLK